mgnify:CR=1 FL=1
MGRERDTFTSGALSVTYATDEAYTMNADVNTIRVTVFQYQRQLTAIRLLSLLFIPLSNGTITL